MQIYYNNNLLYNLSKKFFKEILIKQTEYVSILMKFEEK